MLAVAACAGMSITSCTADKDLYNPEVAEQNVKSEYEANFIKKYGMVSPTQKWDFTTPIESSLPGEANATRATRAANATISTSNYYQVDQNTLSWMKQQLVEGRDNRSKGNPFTMNMPGNSFTIVPIYVGQAGLTWDLHIVIGAGNDKQDIKVWSKGQGMQQKTANKNYWHAVNSGDNTMDAAAVRSMQYTIGNVDPYTPFYFYLEVTNSYGGDTWAHLGKKQSSLDGMMLALGNCPMPNNLTPENNVPALKENDDPREIWLIGCEDADLSGSDHDINDVVFLVYGNPKRPEKIDVDKKVETKNARYLIEDLGATDDFDFNDIVIDVNASREVEYVYVNGVIDYSKTIYHEWKQTATLKHLGGTLPYTVSIGRSTLPWQKAELDVDKNETVEITGWDFENHNITVTVQSKFNENAIVTLPFPKAGDVPMIIAVDQKQGWQPERISIPNTWFTEE